MMTLMMKTTRGKKTCVEEFDVMAITETWVDTANKNFLSEYDIEGYQMFHKDRPRMFSVEEGDN